MELLQESGQEVKWNSLYGKLQNMAKDAVLACKYVLIKVLKKIEKTLKHWGSLKGNWYYKLNSCKYKLFFSFFLGIFFNAWRFFPSTGYVMQ